MDRSRCRLRIIPRTDRSSPMMTDWVFARSVVALGRQSAQRRFREPRCLRLCSCCRGRSRRKAWVSGFGPSIGVLSDRAPKQCWPDQGHAAWRRFREGTLPVPAKQPATGTILVRDAPEIAGQVVVHAQVSSDEQHKGVEGHVARVVAFVNTQGLAVSRTVTEIGFGVKRPSIQADAVVGRSADCHHGGGPSGSTHAGR